MGLTSPALSYLLVVLAAGLLLAIILRWRRMSRRGLWALALRWASLLTLQACVLALIFVTVNRSGEFYSSWSDLFGSDTASASVVASTDAGTPRIRPAVVTSREQVNVPGDRAAGGTLESVRFTGQLSGLAVPGRVFLPAGYPAAGSRSRYPVIVAISNDLSSTSSPYGAVRLAEDVSRQIAARQLEPVIVVMLPAGLSRSDQGCLNVPAQAATAGEPASQTIQASTFFAQDIPAIMESAYHARSTPASWALLGDQSGGYCALQLALANSWVFSAAAVPDGDYSQPPGTSETTGSPQLRQQDDMLWLVRNQPMQPVSILFTGPSFGAAGAGKAEPFLEVAHRPMRVSTAALGSGSWPLADALSWIGETIGVHAPHAARQTAR